MFDAQIHLFLNMMKKTFTKCIWKNLELIRLLYLPYNRRTLQLPGVHLTGRLILLRRNGHILFSVVVQI